MTASIAYDVPGAFTDLSGVPAAALARLPDDPVEICRLAQGLVIQPKDAEALSLPKERFAENQLRPTAKLIEALLVLDPAPLDGARPPQRRVIGTCRHFAVLSCALLRHRGFAARARCGFGTYFQRGKGLDHWVTEYRHDGRWVRIDSEVLGMSVVDSPEDLPAGEFLTGGEAWAAFRQGRVDAATFGVGGTENFGPGEIRSNAIKDLAALNKVEVLPWDEWGRMVPSFNGETGPDYDDLLDTVAAVCAADDPDAVRELYAVPELRVPAELLH